MNILFILSSYIFILTSYVSSQENAPLSTPQQCVVQSSNVFGFKLFEEILKESNEENVFVSPLSVSLALGITYNGAKSNTETQMHTTLEYEGLSMEEINQGYRSIIDDLMSMDKSAAMDIENSVWYNDGFHVLDNFIATATSFHDAVVHALNFSDSTAAKTINSWVEKKTHGKIDAIVDYPIGCYAMFIINAIYFKGKWTKVFQEANTHDETFYETDTKQKSLKMMSIRTEFPYLETLEFQAVDLSYGQGYFGMTIFLPKEGIDVTEFLTNFNNDNWQKWTSDLRATYVDLQLLRFEIDFGQSPKRPLIALGMSDAFNQFKADFSGIGRVFVDDVRHKTYVKMDEQGTEAAAVTVVFVKYGALPEPKATKMFVNRPFVIVIHESHSQVILFMGKIVSPQERQNSSGKTTKSFQILSPQECQNPSDKTFRTDHLVAMLLVGGFVLKALKIIGIHRVFGIGPKVKE